MKNILMILIMLVTCSLVSAVELVMPRSRCNLSQSDIDLLQFKLSIVSDAISSEKDMDPFCDIQIDLDLDGEDDCPVLIKDQQGNYYILTILQVSYSQWIACYRGLI